MDALLSSPLAWHNIILYGIFIGLVIQDVVHDGSWLRSIIKNKRKIILVKGLQSTHRFNDEKNLYTTSIGISFLNNFKNVEIKTSVWKDLNGFCEQSHIESLKKGEVYKNDDDFELDVIKSYKGSNGYWCNDIGKVEQPKSIFDQVKSVFKLVEESTDNLIQIEVKSGLWYKQKEFIFVRIFPECQRNPDLSIPNYDYILNHQLSCVKLNVLESDLKKCRQENT